MSKPKYYHLIWATKACRPVLTLNIKDEMEEYLVEKAIDLGAVVEEISLQPEHVHLLIQESSQLPLPDFMHELKGAASHWCNQNNLFDDLFRWQKGFDNFEVEDVEVERKFVVSQIEIHRKISFLEERKRLKVN